MEGNSNSATLVDRRPASRRNQWDRHSPFREPADVDGLDCVWWDEPRDAFSESRSPLSVAGFVRLGGLNRATSTARTHQKHDGNSHLVDVDVLPPTHVQPSFRPPKSDAGVSCGFGHEAASVAPTAAIAESTIATPEVDRDTAYGPSKEDPASKLNAAANAIHNPVAVEQCPFEKLRELSKRVQTGDDAAMAEIRHILDGNEELWRWLGDVERSTEAMLIEVAGGSAEVKECIRRSVADLRVSLLSKQPTPLERMAVGRVVACWLFANFVDRWCGWSVKQAGRASDLAKLLEAAEKRYGTALKSLKLVRCWDVEAD
jgi:hypothetical protein